MTQPDARIAVTWAPEARSELRDVNRDSAMKLLHCLDRYLSTRFGNVKKLQPPMTGFRLRCGDYRLFFDSTGENNIQITAVRHRREAYR